MRAWVNLCDVLGRRGPAVHREAIALFNEWIAEEPRLWQLYLARGVARLHAGRQGLALDDFKRVESKLRLYDSRPGSLAFITAVEAYALCKRSDTRCGDKLFAEAKTLDNKSWLIYLIHGWSCQERGKYSVAKAEFQMALQLTKKKPQAEVHEAMALLLGACPVDRFRDSENAVEHATKACNLTEEKDCNWICLDTLSIAQAERGSFDAAIKSATKALECAPEENQEPIRQRIALYQEKKPYRLK
jgi:tetratricopeptide (TPR) repeat protein